MLAPQVLAVLLHLHVLCEAAGPVLVVGTTEKQRLMVLRELAKRIGEEQLPVEVTNEASPPQASDFLYSSGLHQQLTCGYLAMIFPNSPCVYVWPITDFCIGCKYPVFIQAQFAKAYCAAVCPRSKLDRRTIVMTGRARKNDDNEACYGICVRKTDNYY
eukprot:scaffold86194_cov36-Prasinocladus_malaysianus.AAC.1